MGKPANALDIYASERPKNAAPLPFTQAGYMIDSHCFITHGRYYIRTVTSPGTNALAQAARHIARKATAYLSDPSNPDKP
jgi:hypothetical protein